MLPTVISPMDRRVSGSGTTERAAFELWDADCFDVLWSVKFPLPASTSLGAYRDKARARLSGSSGLPIRLRYLRLSDTGHSASSSMTASSVSARLSTSSGTSLSGCRSAVNRTWIRLRLRSSCRSDVSRLKEPSSVAAVISLQLRSTISRRGANVDRLTGTVVRRFRLRSS